MSRASAAIVFPLCLALAACIQTPPSTQEVKEAIANDVRSLVVEMNTKPHVPDATNSFMIAMTETARVTELQCKPAQGKPGFVCTSLLVMQLPGDHTQQEVQYRNTRRFVRDGPTWRVARD